MKPITVLSLFDGMSCGQIALERADIPVKAYYASEIDKYAIKITQKNYPKTVQLGDITCWREWNIPTPDLILAGSPCQGFSKSGKGLNFDDPRSRLFFVFCDILAYYYGRNPNLKFLLENVNMKKEWQEVITDRMKVEPVMINSALVSAQNRERLYWTNWEITQPEDKHIYLKDIVEHGDVDRLKSYTIDANYFKGGNPKQYFEKGMRQLVFKRQSHRRAMVKENGLKFVGGIGDKDWAKDGKGLSRNYPQGRRVYSDEGKAASLSAQGVGSIGGATGIYQIKKDGLRRIGTANDISGHDYNKRVYHPDGKGPALNTGSGGNLEPKVAVTYPTPKQIGNANDSSPKYDMRRRVYSENGKSPTLLSMESGGGYIPPKVAVDEYYYRKLTPLECERLQTVPEGYTEGVSNTQRYKMLGNGWTVDVIVHIFNCLKH